jgi:uncharacterized protein YuzE
LSHSVAPSPSIARTFYNAKDMRISYDVEVDALYLRWDNSKIVESDEVKPGIILDFNAKNQVVGIEVLDFKRRVPKGDLRQLKVLVA